MIDQITKAIRNWKREKGHAPGKIRLGRKELQDLELVCSPFLILHPQPGIPGCAFCGIPIEEVEEESHFSLVEAKQTQPYESPEPLTREQILDDQISMPRFFRLPTRLQPSGAVDGSMSENLRGFALVDIPEAPTLEDIPIPFFGNIPFEPPEDDRPRPSVSLMAEALKLRTQATELRLMAMELDQQAKMKEFEASVSGRPGKRPNSPLVVDKKVQ